MSLSAITGNYDVRGGNFPIGETYSHQWANFNTKEHEFIHCTKPKDAPERIGDARYPLWGGLIDEGQMTDLTRQIKEGTPYPIKAMMAFGCNHRMFPSPHETLEAVDQLDFVTSTELFMTEMCKHSDIVLPACTSFEREEFKVYPGGFATYIKPVIDPLYSSKPDSTIIKELADALDLDDPLLRSGYENCVRWMLSDCVLNLDDCIREDLPIKVPDAKPFEPGAYTAAGYNTPTGKFEIWSTRIEKYMPEMSPLPAYTPPWDSADPAEFPMMLSVGARLPFALHSRMHDVPWTRALRPVPMVDMNDSDAAQFGIQEGDWVIVESAAGRVRVQAHPTRRIMSQCAQIYHGYPEADANELVSSLHVDPYSGYPGYNCVRCRIWKEDGES